MASNNSSDPFDKKISIKDKVESNSSKTILINPNYEPVFSSYKFSINH